MDFTGKRTFAVNVEGEINEGYACIEPSVSNFKTRYEWNLCNED